MTELIKSFWDGKPVDVEYLRCDRDCGFPLRADEAIAVIDCDKWAGWAHPECPEDE